MDFGEPRISLDPLRKWKQERVVGKLARGLAAVAKAKGVEVIGGRGVFEDSSTLRIEAGETLRKVRFKHAIVATGSRPSGLPGLTIESERIMDSTAALELPDIPERLLVIGGGYIGLELGTVYAALGSRVTLVEMTDGLLPGVDRDLVQPLQRRVDADLRHDPPRDQGGRAPRGRLGDRGRSRGSGHRALRPRAGGGGPARPERRARPRGHAGPPRPSAAASSRWTSAAAPTTRASTRSATSPASRCSRTARCGRARSPRRRSPGGPPRSTTWRSRRWSSPIRRSPGAG